MAGVGTVDVRQKNLSQGFRRAQALPANCFLKEQEMSLPSCDQSGVSSRPSVKRVRRGLRICDFFASMWAPRAKGDLGAMLPRFVTADVPLGSRHPLKTSQPFLVVFCICMTVTSAGVFAQTYEGFTDPVRVLEVSAADMGRVAEVHVKRGDRVQQGDLLMMLDAKILQAARRVAEAKTKSVARLEALRVEHELRENRYGKLLELQRDGAGSTEEVSRAKADADVARLNVRAAEDDLQLSQLELAEIESHIDQRRIRSPVDGTVTDVLKDVGEFVSTTQPHIATIVQLQVLRVTFYLPTEVAMPLEESQIVRLTFPDFQQETDGNVEYVAEVTEADSGRVRVDVLIDNAKRKWRSGIRCRINLHPISDTDES